VLERDRDENDSEVGNGLSYWLQTFKHRMSKRAPDLIAVTQCDKIKPGQKRHFDQIIKKHLIQSTEDSFTGERLNFVIDGCSACDSDPKSIEPLREALQRHVQSLYYERQLVPEGFGRLYKHVQARLSSRSIVPVTEFRKWCLKCDVADEDRQDTYLRMLHELGLLFYFGLTDAEENAALEPNSQSERILLPVLRDSCLQLNIINPLQWKKPVYEVMNLVGSKPRLHATELHKVIRRSLIENDDREATIHFIRESLRQTELCYYDESRQLFLFPRGLPIDTFPLTADWKTEVANFEYFPEAAFHRFTVKLLESAQVSSSNGRLQHYRWSVIACDRDNSDRVAIVAEPEKGVIEFRMDPGTDRERLDCLPLARQMFDIFKWECMGGEGPKVDEVFGPRPSFPSTSPTSTETITGDRFSRVTWGTIELNFSSLQAKIVEVMWDQSAKGKGMTIKEILDRLKPEAILNDNFRLKRTFDTGKLKGLVWGTFILIEKNDQYRLDVSGIPKPR